MILSHDKKFIYIHVYKVAGTSIRTALQKYDDLATTDFPWHQNMKFWLGKRSQIFSIWSIDHIKVNTVKKYLPEDVFNKYYKFTFIRNPWDWQVSLYHYMLQWKEHPQHKLIRGMKTFDEYIEWRINEDFELQKDFICDSKGKNLMNFVGRFENLQEDFNKACEEIGIPQVSLPKVNTSKHRFYKEYYNKHTRDLIYNAFKKDIELFNYDF
jgi:hypothetical protein